LETFSLSWYKGLLKYNVIRDLNHNPDIKLQLGCYVKKFISWCANQRFLYEADLQDEVNEFNERFITKRLYNTDVILWNSIRKTVFERDSFTCQYCGQVGGKLELDHITPISKGGTNEVSNLCTACRKCNRQKHDKPVEEFLAWRARHG
jgi:hypothetical protein